VPKLSLAVEWPFEYPAVTFEPIVDSRKPQGDPERGLIGTQYRSVQFRFNCGYGAGRPETATADNGRFGFGRRVGDDPVENRFGGHVAVVFREPGLPMFENVDALRLKIGYAQRIEPVGEPGRMNERDPFRSKRAKRSVRSAATRAADWMTTGMLPARDWRRFLNLTSSSEPRI